MVVYDLPVTFDLDAAMAGGALPVHVEGRPPAPASASSRSAATGADVRWFEVDPVLRVPPAQRPRRRRPVVLDVVRYDRMFDAKRLGPDDARPAAVALDDRHRHRHGRTRSSSATSPFEFPRVDERLVGRPHRWGYGAAVRRDDADRDNASAATSCASTARRATSPVIDLGAGRAAGEWVDGPPPRRRRRGRRLAGEPRATTTAPTAASSSCSPPPTPPPAPSPGCCCPTASRSASTATGSLIDRTPLFGAPGFAHPRAPAELLRLSGCAAR